MNRSRCLLILVLVALSAPVAALPPRGGPGPDHPGPGQPRPDLGQVLGLDGEALAKIDALTEQQHLAVFRLHREQMRAEHALHEQFQTELAKILTPEQMQALKAHRQAMRERHADCPNASARGARADMPRHGRPSAPAR